jgi:tetratricopeptide (TPR) repeat protein
MLKIVFHLVAITLLSLGWVNHLRSKESVADTKRLVAVISENELRSDLLQDFLNESKDPAEQAALGELIKSLKARETDVDETVNAARDLAEDKDNTSTFTGILLTFLTAGYAGIVFVAYVLPIIAHRATHTIYDSGEIVEKDNMSEARSKLAQGDYDAAMLAFREAAAADPTNRLPWVEIVKIQREFLHDSSTAIQTIREVLEQYAWSENDAAYFLFRLAELYDGDMNDRDSAAGIMQQVMQQFPETRHSANARHKLHEWGLV